jgi:hypothetical protein
MGGQAAPDTATRARSGRPAGGRRSRGCPDTGHAGRRPVRVLCPPFGRPSNRSSGPPVSTRPVSTRPVPSRCPDRRASGVRSAAAALSAPRWPLERLGAAGRPRWRNGFDVPPWSADAVVARPHPGLTGRDGAGLAVGGSHEGRLTWAAASHRAQAAAPPRRLADKGAGPAPGCWSVGWGARERAGAHQSPRRWVLGRLSAWPDYGAGQGVVTTLCGRGAGDGSVSSVPEGPSGSAGGQAAAAARPRT